MKLKLLISTMALSAGSLFAQESPFPVLDANFYDPADYATDLPEVLIPASPLKYDVIFTGGVDLVTNANNETALAKEWQDFTGYVPIAGRSDSGYVIVNHERVEADLTPFRKDKCHKNQSNPISKYLFHGFNDFNSSCKYPLQPYSSITQ
jgi:hypothetical protein